MDATLSLVASLLDNLSEMNLVEYRFTLSPQTLVELPTCQLQGAVIKFANEVKQRFANKDGLEDGDLVQIKAESRDVLNSRIEAFLRRKDETRQISHEFLQEGECSRTTPFRYRHIGIERVNNRSGPTPIPRERRIEENMVVRRLEMIEKHVRINPEGIDVLQRLKKIEERLLYLESVTPEYMSIK